MPDTRGSQRRTYVLDTSVLLSDPRALLRFDEHDVVVPVVVVTDSSARLPVALVEQFGIRVVPLHVLVDGRDLLDGVDDFPADLYQRTGVTTAGAGRGSYMGIDHSPVRC